jgi:hypothetical protein
MYVPGSADVDLALEASTRFRRNGRLDNGDRVRVVTPTSPTSRTGAPKSRWTKVRSQWLKMAISDRASVTQQLGRAHVLASGCLVCVVDVVSSLIGLFWASRIIRQLAAGRGHGPSQ